MTRYVRGEMSETVTRVQLEIVEVVDVEGEKSELITGVNSSQW